MKKERNSKSEELVRGEETQIYIRVNIEKEVTFLPGGVKLYVFPAVVSPHQKKQIKKRQQELRLYVRRLSAV